MKLRVWHKSLLGGAAALALLTIAGAILSYAYIPRPDSDYTVDAAGFGAAEAPARARVLFDESHHNFLTAEGRGRAFVELLGAGRYQVVRTKHRFSRHSLAGADIIVSLNPLGAWMPFLPGAEKSAFEQDECDELRQRVLEGGSLLLSSDVLRAGGTVSHFLRGLGIQVSGGRTMERTPEMISDGKPDWIVYTRGDGTLPEHPITKGVERVVVFGGQALKGPAGSTALLPLSNRAISREPDGNVRDVPGWSQGLAMEFGKGRMVVLADSAMLTALETGWSSERVGMNRPGNDNRALAMNIMQWLSRADERSLAQ